MCVPSPGHFVPQAGCPSGTVGSEWCPARSWWDLSAQFQPPSTSMTRKCCSLAFLMLLLAGTWSFLGVLRGSGFIVLPSPQPDLHPSALEMFCCSEGKIGDI